jgi:hypothetical protein
MARTKKLKFDAYLMHFPSGSFPSGSLFPIEIYPSLAWDNLFENRGQPGEPQHSRPRKGSRPGSINDSPCDRAIA